MLSVNCFLMILVTMLACSWRLSWSQNMAAKLVTRGDITRLHALDCGLQAADDNRITAANGTLFEGDMRRPSYLFYGITYKSGDRSEFGDDVTENHLMVCKRSAHLNWINMHKEVFSDEFILGDITPYRVDAQFAGAHVSLGYIGSTYVSTKNIIFVISAGRVVRWEVDTPRGPLRIIDLDKDGTDEIVVHSVVNPATVSEERVIWEDVYKYRGSDFVLSNSEYPQIYATLVKEEYLHRLEEATTRFEKGVKGAGRLISIFHF